MASILLTIFGLFFVLTFSVILLKSIVIPYIVNKQYGISDHPDFTIGESSIEGLGIFTKRKRRKGEMLFVAIDTNKQISAIGSKINHCPSIKTISDNGKQANIYTILPNTYFSARGNEGSQEWWIVAARDLDGGEELTADYTYTPDFISKPEPEWICEL
jgi:hypothetical protein